MKSVSLKMKEELVDEIDSKLGENRYSTRTEFIRDAIREKLSELDKKDLLEKLDEINGSSDKKTTDEELHKVREELAAEMD